MTVFKGFLIITKRNLLMVFMYLAIFLTIGILASGSDSNTSGSGFHAQALTIGVVDHDGGVLSKGLSTYLSQYHTIRQMPDDTAKLQDALFNRNVSYIVTIPKDFKVSCLREHQALPVSKIPGSTDGYYVDQQINTYLNQARVLTDSGYSDKEAAAYILKHADSSSHVTMLKSASSEKTPGYGYMYQYLPYVLISILCYVMGLIMIAFHQPDLQKRILCSAVSIRSQNLQLALGYLAVGCSVWLLTTWIPAFFFYRKAFFQSPRCHIIMLNSLCPCFWSVLLFPSSFSEVFIPKRDLLTALVNVVTLGMSFLCGVFVPLDIMGKSVKTVAHFLPVYWYEISNNLLNNSAVLTQAQRQLLYRNYEIQLLFAAAIFCIALVVSKEKGRQHGAPPCSFYLYFIFFFCIHSTILYPRYPERLPNITPPIISVG